MVPSSRFYKTAPNGLLQRINTYLVRWAKRKYKRLRSYKKIRKWWDGLTARQPRLFAHWIWMTRPQQVHIPGRSPPGVPGKSHSQSRRRAYSPRTGLHMLVASLTRCAGVRGSAW